jgi:hypothetical protein
MRSIAWGIALLLVGCVDSPDDEDGYPILPGGGTLGGGTAPGGGGSGSNGRLYRVCKLLDVRDLTSCATSGAGGFRVELGGVVAGTQTDGSFTIDDSGGMGEHFIVSGTGIVTSITPFGFARTLPVPVITEAAYTDMQNATGSLPVAGHGAIMARATYGDAIFNDLRAMSNPASMYPARFDGATQADWVTTPTGQFGAIWVAGVPVGMASLTVTDTAITLSGGSTGLLIQENAITFFPAIMM